MSEAITFAATVASVKTLADGGIRVSFDLPEDNAMQAAQLIECKRWGAVLNVTCDTAKQDVSGGKTGKLESGPIGKSKWAPAQESSMDRDTQAGGQ